VNIQNNITHKERPHPQGLSFALPQFRATIATTPFGQRFGNAPTLHSTEPHHSALLGHRCASLIHKTNLNEILTTLQDNVSAKTSRSLRYTIQHIIFLEGS
jgi:hypothetical protein